MLAGLVVLVAGVNLVYFYWNCPIDLSGDEAQYWDWSRRLDWSYYSKGPLIALVIRAGTWVAGDTMQGVRLPAILLFGVTLVGVYALTRVVSRSDRIALLAATGAVCSPIFIYLSAAMTIDSPMIACWAWASVFGAIAIFSNRPAAWVGAGVAIGIGFLAKYSAFLWFVGLAVFFIWDRAPVRRWVHATISAALAGVFTIPVILWNAQHAWVGMRHVAKQTGAEGGRLNLGSVAEMLGTQIGVYGPPLAILTLAAIIWVIRSSIDPAKPRSADDARRGGWYLLCIGGVFWGLTFLVSFVAKVQANWPGPAYVTLVPLAAMFVAGVWDTGSWRAWRGVVWAVPVLGIGAHVVMRDTSILIPPLKWIGLPGKTVAKLDGLSDLRGWEELGQRIAAERDALGPGTFILADHYQQTALLAFYVPDRPRTFHAGIYFTRPQRMNQYAIWPDMRLDRPDLVGKNAIYLGKGGPLPDPLPAAFDRVEKLPEIPVIVHGVAVETFKVWRCYGFKGLKRPQAGGGF